MKVCTKCGQEKPLSCFNKQKAGKMGLTPACRACNKISEDMWRKANMERVRARQAKWRSEHPDAAAVYTRAYHKKVPGKREAICAARRARVLRATPSWANMFFIEEAYRLAKLRSKITGFKWHVDHIVPLASKVVCGLHVEANLQVIPAALNQRKNNRCWPDMP